MAEHAILHELVLTVGRDALGMIAICSDGSPQLGHEPVTILSVNRVRNEKEAKAWFRRMKAERPWETRQ